MVMKAQVLSLVVLLSSAAHLALSTQAMAEEAAPEAGPPCVLDRMWVWANPDMATPGEHTAASYAQAGSAERASILGLSNVVMASAGLPHDRDLAERWTAEVADAPRLVWEIMRDSYEPEEDKKEVYAFDFKRRIDHLASLVKRYPQIEAVMVDDMTSVAVERGLKPEHMGNIKTLLKSRGLPLKLWGVLYTMNLSEEATDPIVREVDVISLWVWHAKDLVDLEKYITECEKRYPGKPIELGLYMYDYGGGRRMPLDVHQQQCETALKLLHQNRIEGITFLTIKNDAEVVQWTADWIKQVGKQELTTPSAH